MNGWIDKLRNVLSLHRTVVWLAGSAVAIAVSLVPYIRLDANGRAILYYGPLFFIVLLVGSVALMQVAASSSDAPGKAHDYHVIRYAVRLALAFGMGAIAVAVVLMLGLLRAGNGWLGG